MIAEESEGCRSSVRDRGASPLVMAVDGTEDLPFVLGINAGEWRERRRRR